MQNSRSLKEAFDSILIITLRQATNLENATKATFTKSYDLNKLLFVSRSAILQ